jgi:SAM-dependent methyltransferase
MGEHAIYDTIGRTYARYRRPDPRIAAAIGRALGDAQTVLDVGAGTGSYAPSGRSVIAVEPSRTMIAQRPEGAAPVAQAVAEHLPFAPATFDAAIAILTVHHWRDVRAGLADIRRVVRGPIVILTFDPAVHYGFWFIREYVTAADDEAHFGGRAFEQVLDALGPVDVSVVPVPHDCVDGFFWAYWRRPEMYLDPGARACISSLAWLPGEDVAPGLQRLADDLRTGRWRERHADLLALDEIDGGYRLIVSRPEGSGFTPSE